MKKDSHTVDAIQNLKPPTKVAELRTFFRKCIVIHTFVSNFAALR